jgi:hypothetical protein
VRIASLVLLLATAPNAMTQESGQTPAPLHDDATTMETIRVTAPRPERRELDRFENQFAPQPTVFDRVWHEPRSLEQIGMDGGVVPLLVNYAAQKVTAGARRIPGWKRPIQAAIARPPPLDDTQVRRALHLQPSQAAPGP